MRPLLGYHKKESLPLPAQTDFFHVFGMVWPFTFDWCVLGASELVRSAVRTPCCRVLVHKTCVYSSLAVSPSNPTPTCPHCQQVLDLVRFRRLCWRLSGEWRQWFEFPLAPASPHAHSYHWVYLKSMDPPPPLPGVPDDDDRVSGTHRLNPPSPLKPLSHSSFVVPLRCHHDHHHHHHHHHRHHAATPGQRR